MENNQIQVQQKSTPVFNLLDKESFEICQRLCTMYANSELVPDIYKISEKNPKEKAIANCLIAMEMAQRIGAGVLPIMQNMVVIYGKPSFSSTFLIATINTCGRFKPLKFKIREVGMLGKFDYTEYEKTWETGANGKRYQKTTEVKKEFDGTKIMNLECIAYTTEKGSDEILESSPISLRMAIDEGWYTKSGSKWKTMPKQMLMYRAASFWQRLYAPEISMGMKTTEELEEIQDAVIVEEPAEEMRRERAAISGTQKINVDPETGEIKEDADSGSPMTENQNQGNKAPNPGF